MKNDVILQTHELNKAFGTVRAVDGVSLHVERGQRISFDYETTIQKGSLTYKWLDPSGAVVWEKVFSESASGTEEIVSESHGSYTIIVQGRGADGSFNFTWDVE